MVHGLSGQRLQGPLLRKGVKWSMMQASSLSWTFPLPGEIGTGTWSVLPHNVNGGEAV